MGTNSEFCSDERVGYTLLKSFLAGDINANRCYAGLSPEEQRDYLREHYWDRFDFADTLFVREADTAQMVEAYARWVALISDRPADAAPMDSLMRRASASRPMLAYFTMLAQQVIHDPNSPQRNDEFYIPVMQAVLASPYYDEYERIGPAYDLAMASQNRLGQRANDFRYTLASGATGTLYGVKAEYTLLFINNPGCVMFFPLFLSFSVLLAHYC